ncbi:MAG: hypothetical protein WCF28_10760 [Methanobacterium sp.]|uniref:hypothetical protein n=1 Tax=Methanobacterium sp. TaxID=2164 RepID=UPI003C72D631
MLFKLKNEFDRKYKEILQINDDLSSPEYNKVYNEIFKINTKMMKQLIKLRKECHHMEPKI